jgi:hypothetical protein
MSSRPFKQNNRRFVAVHHWPSLTFLLETITVTHPIGNPKTREGEKSSSDPWVKVWPSGLLM